MIDSAEPVTLLVAMPSPDIAYLSVGIPQKREDPELAEIDQLTAYLAAHIAWYFSNGAPVLSMFTEFIGAALDGLFSEVDNWQTFWKMDFRRYRRADDVTLASATTFFELLYGLLSATDAGRAGVDAVLFPGAMSLNWNVRVRTLEVNDGVIVQGSRLTESVLQDVAQRLQWGLSMNDPRLDGALWVPEAMETFASTRWCDQYLPEGTA